MNLFERIEQENNICPSEIINKLGISKSYYSMIKNGDRPISKNIAIKLYLEFGIPFEDLLARPEVHEKRTGTDS